MSITSKSIFGKLAAMIFVAVMLAVSTVVSISKDNLTKPLPQWFEVVKTGDAEMLTIIMQEDAKIELRDLGVTQTRAEFIASLDQWVELNADAQILTREASSTENQVIVEVCYRFASNETYNRETYQLAGGQITGVVQEKIGDSCTGF